MADSLDEKHTEAGTNFAAAPKVAAAPAAQDATTSAAEARKARIRKMRGWLSPRDTVADDFGPEDAALYYGEGHSGWNR